MRFSRILFAGLGVSLLTHAAGSAYFAQDPNTVDIAASPGGAVSVIGGIEDLTIGSKATAIEPHKTVEEVDPPKEVIKEVSDTDPLRPLKLPAEDVVKPVQAVEHLRPVENQQKALAAAAEATQAVASTTTTPVKPVQPAETAAILQGVTRLEQVTEPAQTEKTPPATLPTTVEQVTRDVVPESQANDPIELTQIAQVQPVSPQTPAVPEPVKPTQATQTIVKSVQPNTEILQEVAQPDATRIPVAKPAPPVKKAEPVKKNKPRTQQAKQPQKRGADRNTRKGGEQVTSKEGRSISNGRADARTNDGGTKTASNYRGKVAAKLRRGKRKAERTIRGKLSGQVFVAFTVARNGSVSRLRITRSSGHSKLDQAVLDMVRWVSPMPKFPSDIKATSIAFEVPVQFR